VVGQICLALESSHLELPAWTGRQLQEALDADMAVRNLSWPNRITRPRAFLATRLRYLPARPPTDHTPAAAAPVEQTAAPTITDIGRSALQRCRDDIARARRAYGLRH
jgi:hypothetical protein